MQEIISILKDNQLDLKKLEESFDIKLNGVSTGMTQFQITHFVLNKQEFPTPFAQYLQSRAEIFLRVHTIIDSYYQYRECLSRIKLAEGRIEKILKEEHIAKIREAKTELQELEIEKNKFRMNSIENLVAEKIKETSVFYQVYREHKHFETDPEEEIRKAEEENWKIKSAYYPELTDRYGLTPIGFMELPHEKGGLKMLVEMAKKQMQLSAPSGAEVEKKIR